MKGQFVRHPASTRDVDDIAAFIADENPTAAFRFLEAVEATYHSLADMPEIGATREYGGSALAGLRMFPVRDYPNYLIFYRPSEGGIEVVRVLHAARDIAGIFGPAGG